MSLLKDTQHESSLPGTFLYVRFKDGSMVAVARVTEHAGLLGRGLFLGEEYRQTLGTDHGWRDLRALLRYLGRSVREVGAHNWPLAD